MKMKIKYRIGIVLETGTIINGGHLGFLSPGQLMGKMQRIQEHLPNFSGGTLNFINNTVSRDTAPGWLSLLSPNQTSFSPLYNERIQGVHTIQSVVLLAVVPDGPTERIVCHWE